MLLVHAESSRVLDELIARHHTPELMAKHGATLHAITRPDFIEAEAIQPCHHLGRGRPAGPALYRPYVNRAGAPTLVKAAQGRGVEVFAETCAQYLVLDESVFARP